MFDDDATYPLSVTVELIRWTTSLRKEADNILKLAQKRYRRHHDRHNWFALNFKKGDKIYLDRLSLFRSAAENSAAGGCNKLLSKKRGPYMIVGVNDNTLRLLQDEWENIVSIHRTRLAPASRHYYDRPDQKEEGPIEEDPCSKKYSKENHQIVNNLYVVDNIVLHVGLGSRLNYEA